MTRSNSCTSSFCCLNPSIPRGSPATATPTIASACCARRPARACRVRPQPWPRQTLEDTTNVRYKSTLSETSRTGKEPHSLSSYWWSPRGGWSSMMGIGRRTSSLCPAVNLENHVRDLDLGCSPSNARINPGRPTTSFSRRRDSLRLRRHITGRGYHRGGAGQVRRVDSAVDCTNTTAPLKLCTQQ